MRNSWRGYIFYRHRQSQQVVVVVALLVKAQITACHMARSTGAQQHETAKTILAWAQCAHGLAWQRGMLPDDVGWEMSNFLKTVKSAHHIFAYFFFIVTRGALYCLGALRVLFSIVFSSFKCTIRISLLWFLFYAVGDSWEGNKRKRIGEVETIQSTLFTQPVAELFFFFLSASPIQNKIARTNARSLAVNILLDRLDGTWFSVLLLPNERNKERRSFAVGYCPVHVRFVLLHQIVNCRLDDESEFRATTDNTIL